MNIFIMKHAKYIASLLVFFVGVTYGLFLWVLDDVCVNQIHKEYPSPENKVKAVVFKRDCGPSIGLATHISILFFDEKLEAQGGDVFVINGAPESVAPNLHWTNEYRLNVLHTLDGSEVKAESEWGWTYPRVVTYHKHQK